MSACGESRAAGHLIDQNWTTNEKSTMELHNGSGPRVRPSLRHGEGDMKRTQNFVPQRTKKHVLLYNVHNSSSYNYYYYAVVRPIVNSFFRTNFTTSICREWSNYIYLSDRRFSL